MVQDGRWLDAAPGRARQVRLLAPEGGGFRLGLSETPTADVHGRFGHLALALESMDVLTAWVEHLDAIDVRTPLSRRTPIHPGVFSIDVFDPDGHEIELIYEP